MIIKTRKLPATNNDGERMRATAESGAVLTLPYSYITDDPGGEVALALARALGYSEVVRDEGTNVFTTGE